MSIVAYDGKAVACDGQITYGDVLATIRDKMRRLANGNIVAVTGTTSVGFRIRQWYMSGADPEKWPKLEQNELDWGKLIVFRRGDYSSEWEVLVYETGPFPVECIDPFFAWGSGFEVALGAMAMGASAEEAVRITCRFNIYCSGLPVVMTLYDRKAVQKDSNGTTSPSSAFGSVPERCVGSKSESESRAR